MTPEEEKLLIETVRKIAEKVAVIDWRMRREAAAAELHEAQERDLDSEYGNFVVRRDPPRWKGDSFEGKRLSECTAPYLDALAEFKLWQLCREQERDTDDARKRVKYLQRDVARCRGWARRLREGWEPPQKQKLDVEQPRLRLALVS